MSSDELLLPAGSCLVHVGPAKTGTTAVQESLHATRDRLGEHGVVYASAGVQNPTRGFLAVLQRPALAGQQPPDIEMWNQVVAEATSAADRRVVVSSEFFADGSDERMGHALDQLGRSRVHIVLAARSVIPLLPSSWQQYVRNRFQDGYEDWLEAILGQHPGRKVTPIFWWRYRYDRQITRWVNLVGAENVTVIVADEGDRELLPRTFESLLGLPGGLLDPIGGVGNRSLTLAEAELIRLIKVELAGSLPEESYQRLIRYGVVPRLTRFPPSPGAAKPVTPRWALERAAEHDAQTARAIESSGVRVIGDLSAYGSIPPGLLAAADGPPPSVELPAETVSRVIRGVLKVSKTATPKGPKPTVDGSGVRAR